MVPDPLFELRKAVIFVRRHILRRYCSHAGANQTGQFGPIEIAVDPYPERLRRIRTGPDGRLLGHPANDLRIEGRFIGDHLKFVPIDPPDNPSLLKIRLELAEGNGLPLAISRPGEGDGQQTEGDCKENEDPPIESARFTRLTGFIGTRVRRVFVSHRIESSESQAQSRLATETKPMSSKEN